MTSLLTRQSVSKDSLSYVILFWQHFDNSWIPYNVLNNFVLDLSPSLLNDFITLSRASRKTRLSY